MSAILFPGQGSQVVGMGKEFYNNFNLVKKIFNQADEKLNYQISKIILEGPENLLQQTHNTQPAILTVSYSIFKVFKEEFGMNLKKFKYFAGHSLGEYSALVCAESLKFNDALFLLHERGKAMQEAVPIGKGKMIAILGMSIDDITILIKSNSKENGVCEIANDNSNGQVIVSGDVKTVESFEDLLKAQKVKFIPLKVSAPFHCSLMRPAAEIMSDKIYKTDFKKPFVKIYSNVNAQPEDKPENIKKLLIDQIFSTVKWRESIVNISKTGVNDFLEIGPGKVLTGMVKRTLKNVNSFSINTITDIKNLDNEFKE